MKMHPVPVESDALRTLAGSLPKGRVFSSGRASVAVIIAVAANTEGRREIIGLNVGLSGAAPFWIDFL